MSGAEHLDIASADLKGIKESVACANSHVEHSRENQSIRSENDQSVPSVYFESSGELEPGYADSVLSLNNEDGGSITNWDVGKGLGDSLNATQTVGEGLGMLGNKVQACESDGMGSRMSNCSFVAQQPGDGFNPANVVSERPGVHGDYGMTSEPAEDVTRTSICGDAERLGKSLSPIGTVGGQASMEDSEDYSGPAKLSNEASTCNEGILGEKLIPGKSNRTCVAVEDGNQVSSISHTPCLEMHICEQSRLEHPVGVDSLKSELSSELNVDKTKSFVPELVGQSLISVENAGGLHCELNSENETANLGAGPTDIAQPGSCGERLSSNPTIEDQQDGFGHLSSFNQQAEEKIGTQFQNDSTARGNTMEGSSENNYGSGCVDDLLNNFPRTGNAALECTSPERVANNSNLEETPEALRKCIHGSHNGEQSEQKPKTASEAAPDNMKVELTTESNIGVIESSANNTKVGIPCVPDSSFGIEKNKPAGSDVKGYPEEQARSLSEELTGKPHIVVFGCPAAGTIEFSYHGRRRKSSGIPTENKYPERPSVNNTRALRPRSQDNPEAPEPSSNLESGKSSTGKKRGRKKKTEIEGKSYDEFLRMRKHLRYLLHRIRYEQNLLDAYSSEGWRGQSLEKLRPEKELERAKADINRSKLKIRDLFQHLDSLSAEGRFPDSLFDSEGLIDSEDIFCAKCASKELSTDNDIILCDGACERGFHQFCLEPPLRTEEIPPGDEGWLCPACDCKVDCVDLLNDSQLIKLSIEDSWEKVFPEAIASSTANELDDIMGLPSDDSGDNDYNPDGNDDDDAKVEGSGSSSAASDASESDSSESDFSSVSEDLGALGGDEQNLGLPSDDSEDDDYDPDAANVNEDVEKESSSSDFTSASEDLGAAVHNGGTSGDDEHEPPVPLLEPDQDTAESPPLSGRRHVERLDYKKLYDETYGNGPSDSSDDEEWTDMVSASKRKGNTEKGVSDSSNGNASAFAPRRRGRKKLNPQAVNGSPAQPVRSSEKTSSGGKSTKRPHNRLGEAVTRRLYESFKENQYPDRLMKEKLANELGLTPQRVDKWFGNARWSFNHHPGRMEASMASHSAPPEVASNVVENASTNTNTAIPEHGSPESSKLDAKESSKIKPTPKRTYRKRKNTEDHQPIMPQSSNTETSKGGAQIDSLQTPEAQHESLRKKRKSSA